MTSARAASCAAIVLALGVLSAGLHWGSSTAGGADSYGYVSEAGLWLRGRLTIEQPIARQSPWPLANDTWAPLGYRAAPGRADAIVPLYAPGLPLLMAAFQSVAGYCGAFVVVPISGALAVWLTYLLGVRVFAAPAAALSAAVLLATSPIFLYQLMNPMTDVPVAAAWMLALVLTVSGRPLGAGVAASVALLIRPNLAPIALVPFAWLAWTRLRPLRFALGLVPAILAVAGINTVVYGSPLVSGYGTLGDLYAWSHWPVNARQFSTWLLETQTTVVLLALVYVVSRRFSGAAAIAHPRALLGGFAAAVWLSYLFYIPYDAWWYLRFLLPAWPVMMLLLAVVVERLARLLAPPRAAAAMLAVVTLALGLNGLRIAAARSAFEIGRAERRYVDVARFVAGHTDSRAVFISLQHSGTLRLYANRLTLRFDQLDPAWLDRAVAFLQETGRHPYILVTADEHALFRTRFASSGALGRLDWRPFATLGDYLSIYDAVRTGDGEEPLAIAAVASRRSGWRCDPPASWPHPVVVP